MKRRMVALVLSGGLFLAMAAAAVSSCSGDSDSVPLPDVCALVDLEDGPRRIEGLENAVLYYRDVADAASKVEEPDLSEIAQSYARVAELMDGADRYELPENDEFTEAMLDLRTSELVGICIDHGYIDERFRDGLPGD